MVGEYDVMFLVRYVSARYVLCVGRWFCIESAGKMGLYLGNRKLWM